LSIVQVQIGNEGECLSRV